MPRSMILSTVNGLKDLNMGFGSNLSVLIQYPTIDENHSPPVMRYLQVGEKFTDCSTIRDLYINPFFVRISWNIPGKYSI